MAELYENIRIARKAANLTQAKLAEYCGVDRVAVTQWEAIEDNNRTVPTITNLLIISDKVGWTVSELLGQMPHREIEEDSNPKLLSEKQLLDAISLLSDDKREALFTVAAGSLANQKVK